MAFHFLVVGGSVNFSGYGSFEIGHFLGSFVNQQNHQVTFRVVLLNAFGHIMKNSCFSRSRRSDNQGSLSFAEGTKEIQNPSGHSVVIRLEA